MNLLCLRMNGCATQLLSRRVLMGLMRGIKISDDTRSRTLSRFLILWTTSSKDYKGDGTERIILRRWQTAFLMIMHGGQNGSTRGFWRWWHNGWDWTSRMVTVWHRYSSPDKAIGSLPSVNAFCQKRCSGDITIILS